MGFSQGGAMAGTLILALSAWLLANGPPAPAQLWPYLLFGAVFVILLAHLIHIVLAETLGLFAALRHGVPLALAAYWLGGTPYRWLEYACWIFAAAYIVLAPRMMRAISRSDRRGRNGPTAAQRGFDLQDMGIGLLIVIATSGLIMATGLVAREWGFYAGVGAFLLWPVTLAAVPWYAALVHSEWLMVAVVYGGGSLGMLFYRSARVQRRDEVAGIQDSLRKEP